MRAVERSAYRFQRLHPTFSYWALTVLFMLVIVAIILAITPG